MASEHHRQPLQPSRERHIGKSITRRWLAACLVAVTAAVGATGCTDTGTGGGDNGTIAITLNPTSATIQQGGTADVTATLTRGGGFGGVVNVTVEGVPAGVTGTVGNATTTSATITIAVAATTVPGVYNLTVRGTGTGVTDATAAFTLTVTATPAFGLTLNPTALSIVQGGNAPTTVNIARTNFTAGVALTVEGAPAGVTSAFNPTPATAATSVLTVTVAATVAPGVYNLTVRGTSAGMTDQTAPLALTVTAPTPAYALSINPTALSIVQGANAPTAVTITRTNFDGAVTLSLGNAPAGVTGAFNPAAPTGAASTLTVTVGAAVAPGVYNLTVDGTGTGAANQSTPLTLTVTAAAPVGNFSLTTTPPTSVGLTQGTNTAVTVNVVRTGGFVGAVALTTTGLVTGLTAAYNPASVTTNASTLTLTATAGLAVGAYPIVIHGNSTGLGEQVVNLTVNVNAPSGSGNVTVSFAGCTAAEKPVWAAYQDGNGAWVRVTGTNDVYQFNIAQAKAGVAYVTLDGGDSHVSVLYFNQTELTAGTYNGCGTTNPPVGKTLNGTVANLSVGSQGRIAFGGGATIAAADGAFQIAGAKDGANDLVAYMHSQAAPSADRGFINRGLNPPDGGSLGIVDFTDATKSFAAVPATINLTGTVTGEMVVQTMSFFTGTGANACTAASLYSSLPAAVTSFVAYGVPTANQVGTDYHSLSVTSFDAGTGSSRIVQEDFQNLVTRAGTPFALPTVLAPTVTVVAGPYKRLMNVINRPAEYNGFAIFNYSDQATGNKSVSIVATAAYLGGSNVSFTVPDFSALAGWDNAWPPASADAVQWVFSSFGSTGTACTTGHRVVTSAVTGNL